MTTMTELMPAVELLVIIALCLLVIYYFGLMRMVWNQWFWFKHRGIDLIVDGIVVLTVACLVLALIACLTHFGWIIYEGGRTWFNGSNTL